MSRSSAIESLRVPKNVGVRSPLLWILAPLIGAFTMGASGIRIPAVPGTVAAALVAVLAGFALRAGADSRFRRSWNLLFPLAVLLGGSAWWMHRVPESPPAWEVLPPREIDATVRVVKSFRPDPAGLYWRGIGVVAAVDPLVSELEGQSVIFSVRAPGTSAGPILTGTRLAVRGVIDRLDAGEDEFDRSWQRRGVFFRLRQGRLLAPPHEAAAWRQAAARERQRWSGILTRSTPGNEQRAAVLGAMLLGDRSLLDSRQEENFLLSGTMHLFAVSGLHVVAVGGALLGIFSLLPVSARWRGVLSLILLGIYVLVIGLPPSALRAYTMLLFYSLGRGLWRKPSPFPAVVAAALFILIADPRQLLSLGFQLSFSVVAAILLIALPLAEQVNKRIDRRPRMRIEAVRRWETAFASGRRRTIEAISISVAATAASAPLVMQAFGIFAPGAVLLNPLLVPLSGLVVIDGVLVLITGLAGLDGVSLFLAHAGWLIIAGMEACVAGLLQAPGAYAHRQWFYYSAGMLTTAAFLWISICAHFRSLSTRWPPLVRLSLPLAVVAAALLSGTQVATVD